MRPAKTVYNGVTYYPTFTEAWAARQADANRVVKYALGYAVQWYVSGPYLGPDCPTWAEAVAQGGRFCPPEAR